MKESEQKGGLEVGFAEDEASILAATWRRWQERRGHLQEICIQNCYPVLSEEEIAALNFGPHVKVKIIPL